MITLSPCAFLDTGTLCACSKTLFVTHHNKVVGNDSDNNNNDNNITPLDTHPS